MAASAALAGTSAGCSKPPPEPILPYVDMPEGAPAGKPVFYATTLVRDGYGHGVLAETNSGRPTKLEGNVHHPAGLGTTDIHTQASILQLWDPDRSRSITHGNDIATWQALEAALYPLLQAHATRRGAGLHLLTGNITSPTQLAQIQAWQERYPQARWHSHDVISCAAERVATRRLFGTPARALYRLDRARLVLTLNADPFAGHPWSVRHAQDFMQARRDPITRARLYAVESTPGQAGALADDRLALPPRQIDSLVERLAGLLGIADGFEGESAEFDDWSQKLARRLLDHRGEAVIMAGYGLSARSHALAWQMNTALGNVGRTVSALPLSAGTDASAAPESIASLARAMHNGEVKTLVMLDVNPVYDAPGAMDFAHILKQVPCSVHLGLYRDETGSLATWHVPRAHDLEHWSDALAWDGTPSIVQPVIAPLYGGYSPHALLELLHQEPRHDEYERVRLTWQAYWRLTGDAFEQRWQEALRSGVADTAVLPELALRPDAAIPEPPEAQRPQDGLTALFVPDTSVATGAFSNNAWLQELPRPLTGLTWDNAALLAPGTAARHGLSDGDVVRLTSPANAKGVEAPVLIVPGHAENTITLPLGYGRWSAGAVAEGVGFNAYALQTLDDAGEPSPVAELRLEPTRDHHDFAFVQHHDSTEGRPVVRTVAPGERLPEPPPRPSLYPDVEYPEHAWGMSIDLDACIGCGACTVACQAENNIPVVGKEEVRNGREMHWIRVDRYRDEARDATLFQPVPCMHCENAPCEVVCPVGATVHDSDGLNVQVYNRCVGTRFCSNNCPYKVRRFNFLQYADEDSNEARAQRNPEVTVRQRGVMEKCTYCVQRISRARIEAQTSRQPLRDGNVVTACQAACPTRAIVFGDQNDASSAVRRAKASPRSYALLEELNTRPRTTYLARVLDPDARLTGDGDD